jgi:hypothetical protein
MFEKMLPCALLLKRSEFLFEPLLGWVRLPKPVGVLVHLVVAARGFPQVTGQFTESVVRQHTQQDAHFIVNGPLPIMLTLGQLGPSGGCEVVSHGAVGPTQVG